MANIDQVKKLLDKLESLRTQLNKAISAANGNQQDPTVQKIADQFDQVLNEYIRSKADVD
jgi:hypothetical protein